MEEKKLDLNSIIGFILIGAILMYMLWQQSNSPEAIEARENAKQEQIDAEKKAEESKDSKITTAEEYIEPVQADSTQVVALQNRLGSFAYSATLPSAKDNETVIENDVLYIKVNNKGGYLSEVKLKQFVNYDSVPIYLIKDKNSLFNINLGTTDSRVLNTKDLYFQPSLSKNGDNQVLSMKLKVSESKFLEYRYELKPNDYMLGFSVRSQGLNDVINSAQEVQLDWELMGLRHAKSITYENRYTRLTYEYDDGRVDKLAQTGEDDEIEENVSWISYRQFFFSSILLTDKPFKTTQLISKDLVENEDVDTTFTKAYASKIPLELQGGEINESLGLYYGPTDSKVLKQYDRNLVESIPFGWGIFGWINKSVFIPLFAFLSSFLPHGIAIILMTILVRLVLSPVLYKSYLSQAKMKILKPEIATIQAKYKDNKMKSQQETMALYNKAGASPMSGCLPAFIQLPVFYA
ncbi:MAG: membrane protein insertase YidC, partial [Bacteroidia bacterium]|nr:membrane protein insertase YidC [Bacteroidia bacterium]